MWDDRGLEDAVGGALGPAGRTGDGRGCLPVGRRGGRDPWLGSRWIRPAAEPPVRPAGEASFLVDGVTFLGPTP